MLAVMAGLPASGKSALATQLQHALQAVLLDKDTVRAFLFSHYVDYSREQNDLCLEVIYNVAHYLLSQSEPPHMILDGRTYSRAYQVSAVTALAARSGTNLHMIECVCSESDARDRLASDQNHHVAQDRDFDLFLASRAAAEPIEIPRLIVDTSINSPQQCLALALEYLTTSR